jgi:hypothetical protein
MGDLLLVGLGGLATGIVVGVVLDDALELMRDSRRAPEHARRAAGWLVNNIMFIGLLLVVILQATVGILLLTTKADLSQTVRCQAAYNQQFSQTYRTRVAAAEQVRRRQFQVFLVVTQARDAPPSSEQEFERRFERALDDYIEAEQNYQKLNIPPLPSTFCDEF